MARILFIAPLLLFTVPSLAQRIRFCDTTNVWRMIGCSEDESTSVFEFLVAYSGDTSIGSYTYHKLGSSYIREDTVANKVFIRYFNNMIASLDSEDQVLYDYNWAIGDTVRYAQAGFPLTWAWVTAIDSTMINGGWYKVWSFAGVDSSSGGVVGDFNYNVIEGVGCTNGFDYPVNPYTLWVYSAQLTCFRDNGVTSPLSAPVASWGIMGIINFENAASCLINLKAGDMKQVKEECTVFPNPADAESKIVFPGTISAGEVFIYNALGQQIVNTPVLDKTEWAMGSEIKAPGVYYYRVIDEAGGRVYAGKFVTAF